MSKPIRIFNCPWHVAHQHSLYSIPNTKWGVLKNEIRKWNWGARPWHENAEWVPYYEKGEYDMAILHLDQQCLDPKLGKGQLFRALNNVVKDIPKVIINHGTPFWPERWEEAGRTHWSYPLTLDSNNIKDVEDFQRKFLINGGTTYENGKTVKVEGLKDLIGDNHMIVNSFAAAEQWEMGQPIWHGMNVDEWWDLPKEPRAITTISPGGLSAYYGRELMVRTQEHLKEFYGMRLTHVGNTNDWTTDSHPKLEEIGPFGAYRDFLGRSLLYVNLTQQSPMPRSRTEAMLSGCCVLTTPYQDADKFINFNTRPLWEASETIEQYISSVDELLDEEGINGLLIPDNPKAVSALIFHLITNRYSTCVKIGQEGKKTARKLFNLERFTNDWTEVINKTLNRS